MMARNLLKSPSTDRLRKVFGRANWIIMFVYIVTAICGYISVGHAKAAGLDLLVFREKYGETDYFMNFGQLMLALSLIITLSMLGFALKMIVIPFIKGSENVKHKAIAAFLTGSSALIAMNFNSVSIYMNLAGSFCGTFIVIIFPGCLALNSGYSKNKLTNWGIKSWMAISAISGAISTYYAFMNIVSPKANIE